MAVYTETINLDGNMSEEAKKAAKGIATLEAGIVSANAAMVRAAALGDGKAFAAAAAKADAFKLAIDSVPPALVAEGQAAEDAKAKSKGFGEALDAIGPIALKVAAAIGAAVLAVGALVVKGVELALSASDAKGDMILLFDTLGDGAYKGEQAVAMFDRLGAATGRTRDKLAKTAQAFAAMGVTGLAHLEKLTLASVSASELAKGGGEAFELMYKKIATSQATGQALKIPLKGLGSLADMGLKVDDVAKQMGISAAELGDQLAKGTVDAKRFGDALQESLVKKGANRVADAATDLENVWARAKESVGKFFEDIEIGPFAAEVAKLFGILDAGSETGKILKSGVAGFFKEVLALATKAVPVVREFLTDLIIGGAAAYDALLPVAQAIKAFATSDAGKLAIDGLGEALKLMAIAAGVVLVTLGAVVALVGGTVAALAQIGVALVAAGGLIVGALAEWQVAAVTAGNNFVTGLVNGILGGLPSVVAAVRGLADSATSAFTNAMGIASPSKVMAGLGEHLGGGVAAGVDASAGVVEGATRGMADSAVGGVQAAAPSSAPSGGGGGITVTLEPGAIVIQGGASASVSDLTEQAVAMIFERIASAQGLA